jgi:hypothetical protein
VPDGAGTQPMDFRSISKHRAVDRRAALARYAHAFLRRRNNVEPLRALCAARRNHRGFRAGSRAVARRHCARTARADAQCRRFRQATRRALEAAPRPRPAFRPRGTRTMPCPPATKPWRPACLPRRRAKGHGIARQGTRNPAGVLLRLASPGRPRPPPPWLPLAKAASGLPWRYPSRYPGRGDAPETQQLLAFSRHPALQQHMGDFLTAHPFVEKDQGVCTSRHARDRRPIPRQRGQLIAILFAEKAASNHAAHRNPPNQKIQGICTEISMSRSIKDKR